jgi:signal transduction histidine kinase
VHRQKIVGLLRSSAFRLALQSAAVSVLGALVISLIIYYSAVSKIRRDLDSTLRNEQSEILSEVDDGGKIADTVRDEIHDESGTFYAVLSPGGQISVANLHVPRELLRKLHGYETLTRKDNRFLPHQVQAIRGVAKVLPNGGILYIAEKANALVTLNRFFLQSFAILMGSILLLSMAAGLFVANQALRRVEAITVASQEIMEGDLARRIAVAGSKDEFDRLSISLNQMLDRIEMLVKNIQHISNDISHDLRSPLARLRESLEISSRNAASRELQAGFDDAIAQVDTVLGIFSAMLRIAEIESSSVRRQFKTVDLSGLLDETIATFRVAAEAQDKALVSRIATGLQVTGDRELIEQMLVNVIDNAILYSPSTGRISVDASRAIAFDRRQPDEVVIEVADHGPGIPPSEYERVFRRFVRLDVSRHTAGTGLGLALVAAIADLHHATIALSDNQPGLKFRIAIPI